jgi:Baseplate J-like protein
MAQRVSGIRESIQPEQPSAVDAPVTGKIVYLTNDDDLTGVQDRIEWAQAERIVLVLPHDRNTRSLGEVDFELIRRIGQQFGCDIAIVSARWSQRRIAHDIGLMTFRTIDQAVARKWIANDNVEPLVRMTPPRHFVPGSLRRLYPRRNWLLIGLRLIIAVATFAIIAGAVLVILPSAQVTVTASSQDISLIVPVSLDAQIDKVDVSARTVPATRIDVVVEDVASVPTTGAKDIPRGKSKGSVIFFNVLQTQYTVPKNTVVRTSSASVAVRFVTLSDINVPPAGHAEVAIEAIDEGPGGNVPVNQINRVEGLPGLAVTVLNTQPTIGGGVETTHAVTLDDYKRARSILQEKLLQAALVKMKADVEVVRNGWYVVPNTLFIADVQDETYDRFVTEQADQVTLNMRLQVAGLVVSPADLDSVARSVVADKVAAGYSLLDVKTERGDVAEEGTGLRTEFYVVAHATAGAKIDENEIKHLIRGKTIADAQATLLQTLALKTNPVITVEPAWLLRYVNRLPFVTLRIQTQVKRE